jgi:hypothetical protein
MAEAMAEPAKTFLTATVFSVVKVISSMVVSPFLVGLNS